MLSHYQVYITVWFCNILMIVPLNDKSCPLTINAQFSKNVVGYHSHYEIFHRAVTRTSDNPVKKCAICNVGRQFFD